MLTLILETSSEKGIILLAKDQVPLKWTFLPKGPELSQKIALEVQNLLGATTPDLIAIGVGPGSYTGIRVAAALGKALCYGFQIPLAGFCSLQIYESSLPVLIDARMKGIYALFEGGKPSLISEEDPRLFNLSFASPHPELIQKRLKKRAQIFEKEPDPKKIAKLAFSEKELSCVGIP